MTREVRLWSPSDPDPCLALGCERIVLPADDCTRWKCCYSWTRRVRDDRERRDQYDAMEKEAGGDR